MPRFHRLTGLLLSVSSWSSMGHTMAAAAAAAASVPAYRDTTQPVDVRTADLLARMDLDEKIAQLTYVGTVGNASTAAAVKNGGVGGLQCGEEASICVSAVNQLQAALKKTRLGIPASIFAETTHSGGFIGSTVFPMPVTVGASWNTTLMEEIGAATATEARAAGIDQGLGPILQVCTDPRFGRMEENFGEDPFHVSRMGVAATHGLQGYNCGGANVTLAANKISAQAKHFAIYGAGGRDGYTPMGGGPSERTVFEVYLRPWLKFAQAGGRGVMLSHNMGLWEPMHGNKRLVTDTLRNRFGLLGGYTGSDMGNVMQLARNYGFAKDGPTAVQLSMEAGLDQNMGGQYVTYTKQVVESGELSNETLDRAVGNILRKKFATGLFDAQPTDPSGVSVIDSAAHRSLALEAAREGLVLLINSPAPANDETQNQKSMLPIDMTMVSNVAIIGQLGGCGAANSTACVAKVGMLGGYTAGRISGAGIRVVSIEEAFRERGYNTTWVEGVSATNGQTVDRAAVGIANAVEAATTADLVVIAVGCVGCTCCDSCGCGEAGDRQSFDLEGHQLALLSAVMNATKRVVVVTICGRPVTFGTENAILDEVPALVWAGRPGEEGGNAIADLIMGSYNPSGRLAQNWLRSVGQIYSPANPWYQYKWGSWFENGDRTPISPLFPVSHGLSFTSFNVSGLKSDPSNVSIPDALSCGLSSPSGTKRCSYTFWPSTKFNVSVSIANTGSMDGAVTIFATYYKQTDGVVRWARMLCGFTKVHVEAGTTVEAAVEIEVEDLARWDPDALSKNLLGDPVRGAYVIDGGEHDMEVGQCIDSGVSYGVKNRTCTPLGLSVTIGEPGKLYIVRHGPPQEL